MMKKAFLKRELRRVDKWVRFWRKELGLERWRIRVCVDPDLSPQGRVYWDGTRTEATIVIRPIDEKSDEKRCPLQKTVIHELLHLLFAELGDPCPPCVEEAVEAMSWVLYAQAGKTREDEGQR